jgi:hypothetical protein
MAVKTVISAFSAILSGVNVDQVQRAKIQAAIQLATCHDKMVSQLKQCMAVGLTPQEIGRVMGLNGSEVTDLVLRWTEVGTI